MDHYVYQHLRKDTKEVFYIGKGSGDRAYSTRNRNKYWHNIVNKHDYIVEILAHFTDPGDAFDCEISLIKSIDPVANLSAGGEGGSYWHRITEERREELREKARKSSIESGSIEKMAEMRRGQTKDNSACIASMAEKQKEKYSGAGNPMYGRSHWHDKTEEEQQVVKHKTSQTLKETYRNHPRKYKRVVCPHCGKVGGTPGLTRYHFDNCKYRERNDG